MHGFRLKTNRPVTVTIVPIDDAHDIPDETYEPYAVLRAKSQLLAEFLGCTEDEAERVILERVTSLG